MSDGLEGFGKVPYFATPVGKEKRGINTEIKKKKKKKKGFFEVRPRTKWYKDKDNKLLPITRVKTHSLNFEFKK